MNTDRVVSGVLDLWRGIFRYMAVIAAWVWVARLAWLGFAYFDGSAGVRRHHLEAGFFLLIAAVLVAASLRSATTTADAPVEHATLERLIRAGALVTGVLAVIVLATALTPGLFSDDFVLLELARRSEYFGSAEFVRPVPLIVWRGVTLVGGGAMALHAVNLIAHAVNAAFVGAFENVPDNLDGAYVFRNGLPEAVGVEAIPHAPAGCRFIIRP